MLQVPKLHSYLQKLQGLGFDSGRALMHSGISEPELLTRSTDLSSNQTRTIVENMLQMTGDPSLGFSLGTDISLNEMGLLGHAMIAAPTFRESIKLWGQFANRLYGSLLEVKINELEDSEQWEVFIKLPIDESEAYRFFIEEYLALSAKMGTLMTPANIQYVFVELKYPAPLHSGLYQSYFNCPIHFSAASNCIRVGFPGIDDFLETRDAHMFDIYKNYCERQPQNVVEQQTISYEVHRYLISNLGKPPSLDEMCTITGLTLRTLKRRLQSEGTSFRRLVNEFRVDFAKQNLAANGPSIKEVAFLLGYTDPKPFLRFFKRETGQTIGEFRLHG